MKATDAKLLEILRNVSQFIIPIDQRTFSWMQKKCQHLWAASPVPAPPMTACAPPHE